MLPITKKLTKINYFDLKNKVNKYIVIHYVGAVSTAKNNADYFYNTNRNASANYFVDDSDIYCVVADSDGAWHCGDSLKNSKTGGKYYKKCTNLNSIGIEMCCIKKNGKLAISDKTIKNTGELVRDLMKKYSIPASNVIRHYDVTGKSCPNANGLLNDSTWKAFKNKLCGTKVANSTNTPTSDKSSSKGEYLNLYPTVTERSIYNSKLVKLGTIKPKKFGGLSYKIRKYTNNNRYVEIKTDTYGIVRICIDKNAAGKEFKIESKRKYLNGD